MDSGASVRVFLQTNSIDKRQLSINFSVATKQISYGVLFLQNLENFAKSSSEKTAWYAKEKVTFSDLLKAVRVDLWKDNLFFRKEFSDPSIKIHLESEELRGQLRDFVVELLMQAA